MIVGSVLMAALPPLISGGVTYTRWGRTVCGMGEQIVYKGIVAGPSGVSSSSKSTGNLKGTSATVLTLFSTLLKIILKVSAFMASVFGKL